MQIYDLDRFNIIYSWYIQYSRFSESLLHEKCISNLPIKDTKSIMTDNVI